MHQKTGKLQVNLFNLYVNAQLVGAVSKNKPDCEVWLFGFYLTLYVSFFEFFYQVGEKKKCHAPTMKLS